MKSFLSRSNPFLLLFLLISFKNKNLLFKIDNRILIIISFGVFSILTFIVYCWKRNGFKKIDFRQIEFRQEAEKSVNDFLSKYCNDGPILNPDNFPWTKDFKDNQKLIKQEFLEYSKKYIIPNYNDISKELSGGTVGWKSLFLRIFNKDTSIINKFPLTKKLINSCPCTTAYFSKLEPGTKIKPHHGNYKGVIRYQLSITIPKQWKDCFIIVDGKTLNWKDGDHLMFDDMYLHEVQNNTAEERVILFMDIKRDFNNFFVNLINTIILSFIKSNDIVTSVVNNANKFDKTRHQ
jgi:aspartyl/asparaginyl beta-hydroxylase (cupin superfamily)